MSDFEDFEEEYESKSERKREQHALQDLAVKLADLSSSELEQLPIPGELQKALDEYKRMKSHGAIHRQAQFLGKVMRKIDSEALVLAYEALQQKQISQQHQAEQWREKLLSEDKTTLTEFINAYPSVDRQHIRQLIKDALVERDTGKHPGAQKHLFRYIKQILGQA